MKRWFLGAWFCLGLVVLSALHVPVSHAADITDVADSFDYDNKNVFDFRFRVSYQYMNTSAVIGRERVLQTQQQFFEYFPELRVTHIRHTMNMRAAIGLYKDLELNLTIPLILSETFNSSLTPEAQRDGSSLRRDGIVSADDIERQRTTIFGDMKLGLQWGILNDERDPYSATWVIGMTWTMPTGWVWNPNDPNTLANGGGVGRGAHVLTWHIALSKRLSVFEPYVKVWYSLFITDPFFREQSVYQDWLQAQQGIQQSYTAAAQQAKQEAETLTGDRKIAKQQEAQLFQQRADQKSRFISNATDNGLAPSHQAGFVMGTEIVFWERPSRQQKIFMDLRFIGIAQFEGRGFTMLTDIIADYRPTQTVNGPPNDLNGLQVPARASAIMDHEHYFTMMFQPAVHFVLGKYGFLRLEGMFGTTLPFFLTYAKRGVDTNGNGFVDLNTDEVYPFHTRELDGIGKRVQQRDTFIWALQFYAGIQF